MDLQWISIQRIVEWFVIQEVDPYSRPVLLSNHRLSIVLGFIGVTLRRQYERSSDINSKSTIYLNVGMYRFSYCEFLEKLSLEDKITRYKQSNVSR